MNMNRNILIVRTDRIGDVVLTLPLASLIKKHYPESKVAFLVREYTAPLLFNNNDIDEILILKENKNVILENENIRLLSRKNFDTAFIVNASFKLASILFKSKIKNRIGTGYRWYSFLFNNKIFVHRKNGNKHELEYNVDMLQQIDINENVNANNVCFNIQVDNNSKQIVDELLKANQVSNKRKRIIVHPGTGGSAFDLPKEKLKILVGRLARELNTELIITGSNKEIDLCAFVAGDSNAQNFSGKLNLSEMIALIDSADILIANSTGPIHIAAALNKFVVGFYPTIPSMSKTRWGPFTSKGKVFEPDNCMEFNMKQFQKNNCMNNINVEEVFDYIKNIINKIQNN